MQRDGAISAGVSPKQGEPIGLIGYAIKKVKAILRPGLRQPPAEVRDVEGAFLLLKVEVGFSSLLSDHVEEQRSRAERHLDDPIIHI